MSQISPVILYAADDTIVELKKEGGSGIDEQARAAAAAAQSTADAAQKEAQQLARDLAAEAAARSEADAALDKSIEEAKSPILIVTFQGNEGGTLPAFGSDPAKLEFAVPEPYYDNYKVIGILSQEFKAPNSTRIPVVENFSFTMVGQKSMKMGLTAASSSAAEYASYTIRALLVKDGLVV